MKGKKCCLAILITILVIVVLVVAAVVTVLFMTPTKLHMQNIEVDGESLESMGLADTKFIDIIKQVTALTKAKEGDLVTNAYDEEASGLAAMLALSGSNAETDHALLLESNVTYDKQAVISYADTTIAYLINDAIRSAETTNADYAKVLKDANVTIKEVTITKPSDTQGKLHVVGVIDVSELLADQEEGYTASISKVYVSVDASFTVGNEGETQGQMQGTFESIALNGQNNAITKAILKVVANNVSDGDENALGNSLVDAATAIINHLGKIGTASTESDGTAVNPSYGMVGVGHHLLTVVSRTH